MKPIKITNAVYISGYQIKFTFSDNKQIEIDFSNFLQNAVHSEIQKYLDIKLFKKFKIINGDIDWNDFDMCFPIYDIYTGQINGILDKVTQEAI